MDFQQAQRLIAEIPDGAKVVDVGGGASPFPRADYVLDALPYDGMGSGSDGNIHQALHAPVRFSKSTWVQADLCDRRPWPFPDKSFDFAICSHLLEDIRDPIWVCSELRRIAKAGYIETPSRVEEQSLGVENPRYAGFYHHRWLVSVEANRLVFRHKPHSLHSLRDAIVTRIRPGWRINPRHGRVTFSWTGSFEFGEALAFSEQEVNAELCEFARQAARLPDLKVRQPTSVAERIKREIYWFRLSLGLR